MSEDAPARPFLDLIEAALNERGQTKSWLARNSGVSRATINNWRWQPRTPQAGNVLAIADVLEIAHDEALRLAGLAVRAPAIQEGRPDLGSASDEELVAELHRRLKNR